MNINRNVFFVIKSLSSSPTSRLNSFSDLLWAKTTRDLGTKLISEVFLRGIWNLETSIFLQIVIKTGAWSRALYCILTVPVSTQLQPSSACAGPVITCFYHRLVQAVRWHWEQWADEKNSPIKSKGTCEATTNIYVYPCREFVTNSTACVCFKIIWPFRVLLHSNYKNLQKFTWAGA